MVKKKFHWIIVNIFRITPGWIAKWIVFWLKPKYVVGVVALVTDQTGRLLVLHHTYRKSHPWRLPGGIKERNEHAFDTAERELLEEANMRVRAHTVFDVAESTFTFDVFVLCELVEAGPFNANAEVDDFQWIELGNCQLDLTNEQQRVLTQLVHYKVREDV